VVAVTLKNNVAKVGRAGGDVFVAGSAVFESKDYGAALAAMRKRLARI
jgi:ribulose-phosphate 3-epimerase